MYKRSNKHEYKDMMQDGYVRTLLFPDAMRTRGLSQDSDICRYPDCPMLQSTKARHLCEGLLYIPRRVLCCSHPSSVSTMSRRNCRYTRMLELLWIFGYGGPVYSVGRPTAPYRYPNSLCTPAHRNSEHVAMPAASPMGNGQSKNMPACYASLL